MIDCDTDLPRSESTADPRMPPIFIRLGTDLRQWNRARQPFLERVVKRWSGCAARHRSARKSSSSRSHASLSRASAGDMVRIESTRHASLRAPTLPLRL